MSNKRYLAMVLAGGRGVQLGSLTRFSSKPAIHFGCNYRIIDFTLNNCIFSGIKTIGIISQYMANSLNEYISATHHLNPRNDGIHLLPTEDENDSYSGNAYAIFKNIEFIERHNPEHVLVLAGDHIYKMDYNRMVAFHCKAGADITVASTPVSISDAPRFGIINAEKNGHIYRFEEKPQRPRSNLASMGIYVFKWSKLKKYLLADSINTKSRHDFGKNILPTMLNDGESMYTYEFDGYWRDVGTVYGLWEAHMDQLSGFSTMQDNTWETSRCFRRGIPYIFYQGASVHRSIVSVDSNILGDISHSVLSDSISVGRGSIIENSVIMPSVRIGSNVKIRNTVIGQDAVIMNNVEIGTNSGTGFFMDSNLCSKNVSLVEPKILIPDGMRFRGHSHICREQMSKWNFEPSANAKPA